MSTSLEDLQVEDGDPVGTEHIAMALTAGELVYDDGATQRFEPGGATTYVDHGRPTTGTWYLDDDGRFCSFWPPTYRACYDPRWSLPTARSSVCGSSKSTAAPGSTAGTGRCRDDGSRDKRAEMSQNSHSVDIDGVLIRTARLHLAPWTMSDVEAALSIFGDGQVARWLAPAMNRVPDMAAMRQLISGWVADNAAIEPPLGRWKITDRTIGHTVGAVSLLPLPPDNIDSQISVQIARDWWRNGYAGEAGDAIAHYAFDAGTDEIFAVSRPANQRAAAAARHMGMEWVGQTDKYYNTILNVFRLRRYDLDTQGDAAPPEADQTDELTDI